jgi:glycine C-acetyltransferase
MYGALREQLNDELKSIREQGLYKDERVILGPQSASIRVQEGEVTNFCANNYLGLSSHPRIIAAAHRGLDEWGFGMSSVRFICGTQTIHKQLEAKISEFLSTEDTILYSSCFDANGGLFETLLTADDAVISDELNHASIIDGVRLCKAKRFRYKNNNMADLQTKLKEADEAGSRNKMITTDGVFSMDGYIANLADVCDLADKYSAIVHFDDCHATGFVGKTGRGTHEHNGVLDRIDLTTGTLGKALGGASGGYTSGRREFIELLRQRSRPYLFSNTLAPMIAGGALRAIELLQATTELRDKLATNTQWFRQAMTSAGFDILAGTHPITPIMLGDAELASRMADRMLELGVYVIGFSYPVVPMGKARIRVQVSAAHSQQDLEFAVEQFKQAQGELLV